VLKTIDRWRTSGRPICPCTLQMHLIVVFWAYHKQQVHIYICGDGQLWMR
jgi:hypothetical protein